MNLLAVFGVLTLGFAAVHSTTEVNPKEPNIPIYNYDDYESCYEDYISAMYCIVRVATGFVEQGNVPISKRLRTNDQPNIRTWAVCVPSCEDELALQDQNGRPWLIVETADTSSKSLHQIGRLVSDCIRNRLHEQYNSIGYVHVEHCESSEDQTMKSTGWVGFLFLAVCLTAVGLTLYASVNDEPGQSDVSNEPSLVQAFSFRRNWATFTDFPVSETHQDFQYIEGIRVFICVAVIFIHAVYGLLDLPTTNPEVLQHSSNTVWGRLGSILSPVPVQIFFTISGLLMAVNFLQEVRQKPQIEWLFLVKKIVNRLIRLLPTYLLWVMFTVSWFETISHGPIAYHTLKIHSQACREVWWANFLFINNLPMVDYICMEHSWYLGADMQMFVLALGLLTIVWRFPEFVSKCFVIATIAAMLIPTVISYYFALDPIFLFRLNEVLDGNYQYRWIRHLYMPGYTNLITYLAGIIAGFTYVTIINGGYDFRRTKLYRNIRSLSVILLISTPLASFIWLHVDYDSASIWPALFNTLGKCYVPLFLSICFMEAIGRPAGLVRSFLRRPIFGYLGKLCYIVYIVQHSVVKSLYSRNSPKAVVDYSKVFIRFAVATVISFGLAFVIYMCVEQPLGVYLKAKLIHTTRRRRFSRD